MGIAISRKHRQGRYGKIGLIFAVLVLSLTSIGSMISPVAAQNAQGDREKIVTAASGTWASDARIQVAMTIQNVSNPFVETVNFIDSNPGDSNRRFIREGASWCADDTKESLTLGTNSASGTLHYLAVIKTTASAQPRNCDGKLTSINITIGGVSNAQNYANDCSGLGLEEELQCIENREDGNAEFARVCSPPASDNQGSANLNNPLCAATPPPAGAIPPATGDEEAGDGDRPPHECDSLGDFSLRWVMCPILTAGVAFADFADTLMEEHLHYDTVIFNTEETAGQNFKTAWGTFRAISLSLLLIVGLIIVISQAANLQILDAYTFRKVLPRLLISVVGITLSWEIMEFIVTLFNDLGHWILSIILAPFQGAAEQTGSTSTQGTVLGIGVAVAAGLTFATAGAVFLGPLGILSLIITIVMAMLIGMFVLLTRSAVITLAVITAPLAMACWALPSGTTQKVTNFWQNATTTALAIFPAIMMMVAIGKVMSLVTENGVMKLFFLVLPYFLLPLAGKAVGGVMSTILSLANDKSRGVFDRMKNVRQNQFKKRSAAWQTGSLYRDNALTRPFNAVGRGVGAVKTTGKIGAANPWGETGRAARTLHGAVAAEQALKNNPALAQLQTDDDANAVLGYSGGSVAGMEQAARDIFTDQHGVYDAARANRAMSAARAVGINRVNAEAAITTMMKNKARAVGTGNVHATDNGVRRLARNESEYNAIGQQVAWAAREGGRSDLGGTDWIDYGHTGNAWQQAVLAHPGNAAAQWQAISDRTMIDGLQRSGVSPMLSGHPNQARQYMQTLSRVLRTSPSGSDERLHAAIVLKELQGNLPQASGDVRDVINEVLYSDSGSVSGGLNLDDNDNVADQLANLVGTRPGGRRVTGQVLTTLGRTYPEYGAGTDPRTRIGPTI